MPRHGVVGDGEVDRFQTLDLIPDVGGFFELKVLGGFAHLVAQTRPDGLPNCAPCIGLSMVAVTRFMSTSPSIETGQNVLDVLLHCLRRDAVFLVIGQLFGAAAVGFAQGAFHRTGDACRHT